MSQQIAMAENIEGNIGVLSGTESFDISTDLFEHSYKLVADAFQVFPYCFEL